LRSSKPKNLVKNPKFEPFLRASEVLGGLRSRKEKKDHNSTVFWAKNKIRSNFI
jgi:hypothetical protein